MSGGSEWQGRMALLLGATTSLVAVGMAAQLPLRLGFLIYTEQILAVLLALALGVCFLTRPLKFDSRWARLADSALAGLGLAAGLYLAFRYPALSQNYFANRPEGAAIGAVLVPLTLEALRRTAGPALAVVALSFMAYALFADLVPGRLQGRDMAPVDLMAFATIDANAMLGLPLAIVAAVVVVFIVFGQFLQQTGGANWFTDLATSAVGRYRGGPAKIAIVASGLFGSISGSAVANVASTGILTIPMMKKAGLPAARAAAYEAVASTGGQIAPPVMGAAAFLMAEFLEMSYADVVIAAVIPAALFYFALLLTADMDAARLGMAGLPPEKVPPFRRVLREGWYFAVPFAVLVFMLFAWNKGPAEAVLWAAATLIVLAAVFGRRNGRIGPAAFLHALARGGIVAVDVILVGAVAGIIIGILENTGLSFGLTYVLVGLGESDLWILLGTTAVICVLLGMGMPTTGIYVLVATLAGPPLIKLGIDPMAAHLFVLYFGLMSMISPPVAIAAFTAASIAGAGPMKTAMSAMRIGWIAFVMPFLFVTDTALLMQGSALDILLAVSAVLFGIWAVAAALSGQLIVRLDRAERAAALAAGSTLLASCFVLQHKGLLMVAGGAGVLALFAWTRRRAAAASTVGA